MAGSKAFAVFGPGGCFACGCFGLPSCGMVVHLGYKMAWAGFRRRMRHEGLAGIRP